MLDRHSNPERFLVNHYRTLSRKLFKIRTSREKTQLEPKCKSTQVLGEDVCFCRYLKDRMGLGFWDGRGKLVPPLGCEYCALSIHYMV